MGVVWNGSFNRSPQPFSGAARVVRAIRRRVTRDRVAVGTSRPVVFSEWADALGQLHKVAAGSTNREAVPVPRWGFLTPAADSFGASSLDAPLLAVTQQRRPDVRSEVEA